MQMGMVTALKTAMAPAQRTAVGAMTNFKQSCESFGFKLVMALIAVPWVQSRCVLTLCCTCSRFVSAAVELYAMQLNTLFAQGSVF